MKKLLMMIVLVLAFTSCSTYTDNPKIDAEEVSMIMTADTLDFVVITKGESITYVNVENDIFQPVIETTKQDDAPVAITLFISLIMFGIGILLGMAIND